MRQGVKGPATKIGAVTDYQELQSAAERAGRECVVGALILDALAREIEEETGWTLMRVADLLVVTDWETVEDGRVRRRREFDFVVEVPGDLTRPQLESGKHVESRWIGPADLELLSENLGVDGGLVRRIVECAFHAPDPPPGDACAHPTV